MNENEHKFEKVYTTKEMSLTLNIGTSTLRKWCLSLEENGYTFLRAENNRRLFVERDLIALRYFQKLVQGENFSLENSSKVIISRYKSEASESGTPSVLVHDEEKNKDLKRSDEVMQSLLDHIDKQEQFNRDLLERLDQQQKYIDERLEKRDNLLMDSLKESREERQRIAQAEQESKKGWLARLFVK